MVKHKLVATGQHKVYKDLKLNKNIKAGAQMDITLDRVAEINKGLEDYDIKWVRVEDKKESVK